MTTINQLTSLDTVAAGDQVPVWSNGQGDTRRASMTTLAAYMQGALSFPDPVLVTQYASPTYTGFSVTIAQTDDTWLILTPLAGYAAGTVVLPAAPADQQTVNVVCTQIVTALTVDGNGNSVVGAPTTLAANGFFTVRFDDVANIWHRVG